MGLEKERKKTKEKGKGWKKDKEENGEKAMVRLGQNVPLTAVNQREIRAKLDHGWKDMENEPRGRGLAYNCKETKCG